jgi:ectoine hydroxylase-related dioxygenase (phytanoyl-CoA dioxygenase family)
MSYFSAPGSADTHDRAEEKEADELVFDASMPHSAEQICTVLREHGVVLLRHAVSSSLAPCLRDQIDDWHKTHPDEFQIINGVSGGHLREPVDPLLEHISRTTFLSIAKNFLAAERIAIPVNHLLFRRRDDMVDALREREGCTHFFHQDHGLIPESFPLNAWLALSDVDDDCNGLTLLLPCPSGPTSEAIDPEGYVARHAGRFWTPKMSAGDLLMFHHFTIHGSWLVRGKPRARYSVEFRTGNLGEAPPDYANVLWQVPPGL